MNRFTIKQGLIRPANGFTRADLLCTLATLAVLSPLVFGALSLSELKSRQAVCINNSRELTAASSTYIEEHKKPIPYENPAFPGGTWMGTLTDRLKDPKVMICPNAPLWEPAPSKGNRRGSADQAWVRWTEDGRRMFAGSYGYNAWLYSDPVYLRKYFPLSNDQALVFTNATTIEEPAKTPVFVDANWVDLLPRETDTRWYNLAAGAPFGTGFDNHMGRCFIARHGETDPSLAPRDLGPDDRMLGSISVGFVDGHVATVPLETLWSLSWHRNWKPSASPPE
jgi:prepilin-type processing-associated H-X9-DG protein